MAKHFENFTMQVAKAHRMGHDKSAAYEAHLQNLFAEKYSKRGTKSSILNATAPKTSLVSVLAPLLVSNGALTNVATSIVFMQKPNRRIKKSPPSRAA